MLNICHSYEVIVEHSLFAMLKLHLFCSINLDTTPPVSYCLWNIVNGPSAHFHKEFTYICQGAPIPPQWKKIVPEYSISVVTKAFFAKISTLKTLIWLLLSLCNLILPVSVFKFHRSVERHITHYINVNDVWIWTLHIQASKRHFC